MANLNDLRIRISADGSGAIRGLGQVNRAISSTVREVDAFERHTLALRGALTSLAGQAVAALGGLGLASSFIEANRAATSLRSGLTTVTGSMQAAGAEMEYIQQQAQRLGLEVTSAGQAYLSLSAAAKGTALAGQASRDIFESVALAMAKLGKSSDDTQGALLAIEQMISKGKVSAEELRGQLGERLPGAFQAAAKAMGVTTVELDKMLSSGSVAAEQMLPKLAVELNRLYNDGQAISGFTAEWKRLKNAWDSLMVALGDAGAMEFVIGLLRDVTGWIEALNTYISGGELQQDWVDWAIAIDDVSRAIDDVMASDLGRVLGSFADLVGDILLLFPELPYGFKVAVVLIAAEADKTKALVVAAIDSLVVQAEKLWLDLKQSTLEVWYVIEIAIANVIARLAGHMRDMMQQAASSLQSLPDLLVPNELIANLEAGAEKWHGYTAAAADAGIEQRKMQAGIQGEIDALDKQQKAIEATTQARVDGYDATAAAVIGDLDAQRSLNQEFDAAVKMERDLENGRLSTAKSTKAAAAATTNLGGATDKAAKSTAKLSEEEKELKRQMDQAKSTIQNLIQRYLPARAAAEEYAQAMEALALASKAVGLSQAEVDVIIAGLTKDMEAAAEAARRDADGFYKAWAEGVDGIDDSFQSLWRGLVTGQGDALSDLKHNILEWLADLSYQLLLNPLVIPIQAAMMGMMGGGVGGIGGSSGYGQGGMGGGFSLGGIGDWFGGSSIGSGLANSLYSYGIGAEYGFGGMGPPAMSGPLQNLAGVANWNLLGSNLIGSLVGSALFKGKGYSSIGAGIGSTAGSLLSTAFLTPILGPFAPLVGSLLGGSAGGFLGSLFGESPSYGNYMAVTGTDRYQLGQLEDSEAGAYATGGFGLTFGLSDKYSGGIKAEELKGAFQAMADLTKIISDFFGPELSAEVEKGLKAIAENSQIWLAKDYDAAVGDIVNRISDLAGKSGDKVGVAFDKILGWAEGTAKEVAQQVEEAMAATLLAIAVTENWRGELGKMLRLTGKFERDIDQLVKLSDSIKLDDESTGAAMARLIAQMGMLSDAAFTTGQNLDRYGAQKLVKIADDLAKVFGGVEQANAAIGFYMQNFMSSGDLALRQVDQLMEGLEGNFARLREELAQDFDNTGQVFDTSILESLPQSRDQFTQLIEGIDLTTASGQKLYAEMLKLAPAFDALFDAIETFEAWIDPAGQVERATARVESVFKKLGLAMPSTYEALQELYLSGKLTAEQMGVLGSIMGDLQQVFQKSSDAARQVEDSFASLTASLTARQTDLEYRLLGASQGDAAEQAARRAAELEQALKGLTATEQATIRAQYARIWALEDEIAALERARAAAQEHASLEIRLAEARGDSDLALQLRRQQELNAAADDYSRALLRQIYAYEDAARAAAAAEAAAREAEAAREAAIREAEAAAREAEAARRAAYDAQVRQIEEQNRTAQEAADAANQAARDALQAMQEAAQQAAQLASDIASAWLEALSSMGLATEATALSRRLQQAEMAPELAAVWSQVWPLQDQAAARAGQADLAINALSLLGRDSDAQAAERARVLAATDPALRAMQEWVWQLEDAQAAAEESAAGLQELIDGLDQVSQSLGDTIKRLDELITGISPEAIAANRRLAQQQLANLLDQAGAGTLPTQEALSPVLSALGDDASALFGDRTSYLRDLGRTRAQAVQLKALVDAQIPIEQQALEALKDLPVALLPGFDAIVAQIGVADSNAATAIANAANAVDAAIAAIAAREAAMAQSITEIVPAVKEIPPYIEQVPPAIRDAGDDIGGRIDDGNGRIEQGLLPLSTLAGEIAENLGAIDLNVDGLVSYEEFAAFFGGLMSSEEMRRYFDLFDSNDDNMIDRLELIKANTAPLITIVDNLAAKFSTIDLNIDGQVTWEEFNAFFGGLADEETMRAWFDAIDVDQNGIISRIEATNAALNPLQGLATTIALEMSKVDLNLDGLVTYTEFQTLFGGLASAEQMRVWFDRLDLNGNGLIDQVELIKGSLDQVQALSAVIKDSLSRIDLDGDKIVTKDEFTQFFAGKATDAEITKGFGWLDANGDSMISLMELYYPNLSTLASDISTNLGKVDLNVDGMVTYQEFATFFAGLASDSEMKAWFDRLDTDQNGLISQAELSNIKLDNVNAGLTGVFIAGWSSGANTWATTLNKTLADILADTTAMLVHLANIEYFTNLSFLGMSKDVSYTGSVGSKNITITESLTQTALNKIVANTANITGGNNADLLAQLQAINTNTAAAKTNTDNLKAYTDNLEGYLDGVEASLGANAAAGIWGVLSTMSSTLSTISGYLSNIEYYTNLTFLGMSKDISYTGSVGSHNISVTSSLTQTALNGIQTNTSYLSTISTNIATVATNSAKLTAISISLGATNAAGIWQQTKRAADNLKAMRETGVAAGVGTGFATGGIASGPTSGYPVTLHGTEAVIPLGDGNRVRAILDSATVPNYIRSEAGDTTDLRAAIAELQAEIAALRSENRSIGAATVGELKDHNRRERKRDAVGQKVEVLS